MSYSSTLDNPPNPVQAYAGNKPGQEFFRNLAETLNAAHRYNDLHIFSQGFSNLGYGGYSAFNVGGSGIVDYDIIEVQAPRISDSHIKLRFSYRAYHIQSGSSSGTFLTKVFSGASSAGITVATSSKTLSNGSSASPDFLDVTLTAPVGGFADFITVQVGLGCTAGASVLADIAISWLSLQSASINSTKSPEGAIIPVGTGMTTADEPVSAALGYALATTANTLQKRKHVYFGACGLNLTNYGTTGEKYIMPFVRPHITRVQNSTQSLTINYHVKAQNTGSTTKSLRIQALDVESLFQSRNTSNHFSTSGDRSEFVERTVAGNTTANLTGTIVLSPPFQTLRNIADGHFIALAVGTRAMAPRGPMRYNDGTDFDDDLKIISYTFWGE